MISEQSERANKNIQSIVYPQFSYDSKIFKQVDNKPIQTAGMARNDDTIIIYGTNGCCFWPVNNNVLRTMWKDNVTSISLGDIDSTTYYIGKGENIIPVAGFIGVSPFNNPMVEKFYNFSGALNINNRHINLDIEAIMGYDTFVYVDGYITRICFMFPTICINSTLSN